MDVSSGTETGMKNTKFICKNPAALAEPCSVM